jgi:hypothetical protein
MESIAPYLPLTIIVVVVLLISKWRKRSTPKTESSQTKEQKNHKPAGSGDWTPMSLYKEKVVGVTKRNEDGVTRQSIIKHLSEGDAVRLIRDLENIHDSNAIGVYDGHEQIGFIDAGRASELAPQMDKGYKVEAWVDRIMGGDSGRKYGVLIAIQRYKPKKSA